MSDLFITILNMSFRASWLILAVLVLRLVFRRVPKWVLLLLWGVAAIRLAVPVSFESILSLLPSRDVLPPDLQLDPAPAITTGLSSVDASVNPIITQTYAPAPGASVNPLQIWFWLGSLVWITGVVILLLYLGLSCWRVHRRISEAVLLRGNLYQCDGLLSPFVYGLIRPRIYLPCKLEPSAMSHVIAHEQAHIRRRDHWWKLLGFLLLTVHWFNPLVWAGYVLLCRDIELACDEAVIRELDPMQRADYSQALLTCSAKKRVPVCPLAFGEIGVKTRVKRVLRYRKPAFWVVLTALILCAAVAVGFLTDPVTEQQDLSLLNVKNLVPVSAQQSAVFAIWYPPAESENLGAIRLGEATGSSLANYLEMAQWKQRSAPWDQDLPSPGSVEFVLEEDHRITVYRSPRIAKVTLGEDVRWYRTGRSAYETAVALLEPTGTYSRPVLQWFDYIEAHPNADTEPKDTLERELPEFPGTVFHSDLFQIAAVNNLGETSLLFGQPVLNAFFADLNGDERRELCATVAFGSGMGDHHVIVVDYASGREYALWERGEYDYELRWEDGSLICDRRVHFRGEIVESGYLSLNQDTGKLEILPCQ